MLLGFSMKVSVAVWSNDFCPDDGNRLAKHTVELWVYIGTFPGNPLSKYRRDGMCVCVIT